MENKKSMMKYHQINVTLDSGAEIILKVKGQDYYEAREWLDSLSGISYEDVKAVLPIKPHTTKKMEGKESKITLARMKAGLTQEELSELLGVSRTQLQRWEYGYNRIRVHNLKRIAEVLNVDDWTDLMEEKVSKITTARLKAGLTQKELADLLGVWLTQEQRWEHSFNNIEPDVLKRIADALHVDVAELIEDE